MNTLLRFALATALVTAAAGPASAGDLKLSIANGRVTLIAKDVTIREILAEWSRIGQTRIVNAEKVAGGPVTLELTDVPEAQALDAILRSAAGYAMAPRMAGSPGASLYDRILILASSRAPVVAAGAPAPFTNRQMPIMPANMVVDDDEAPQGLNMVNVPVPGQPGAPVGPAGAMLGQPGAAFIQQPPPPVQPQTPNTASRPGMLPAPPMVPQAMPNPYLGTAPGPTSPTFNPNPPPPTTIPRGPGGGA